MESGTIKHCLSIKEPYVSLIMARSKTIEQRSRKFIARPPETIAIATSKAGAGDYLPGGYIVGVARISSVVPWREAYSFYNRACMLDLWNDITHHKARGVGGYAMMISSFAACEPVPIRGNVGLYKTPEGFKPVYADSVEQLRAWWASARVWSEGAANDDEAELMQAMLENGGGWRIDD